MHLQLRRIAFRLAVVALVVISVCAATWAQTVTGSIRGSVMDQTGAAIPEAQISARNISTGVVTTTESDASGTYNIQTLPIGAYIVSAKKTGFKITANRPFSLEIDQIARIDLKREVGEVTTTVDVAAATAQAATVAGEKALGFIRRLEDRMDRDMKRLKSYYHALLDDASDRNRRTMAEPDKTAARTEAVELELQRKTEELRERYTLRPALRPVALVRLDAPALAVTLHAQRREGEKQLNVYWNAMSKTLEPLACGQCGRGIFSIHFAEDFTPLCAACGHK